ncbi:N-acetylglutamate synthase-like GNAT family acetyltransferase [Anaerosolibacter carboniphilus]|uniref:N-acetylglutamate synthase-like GNAT family acetyltransferase n=1 Tax=Anaerosolibacter carboniphilus TaxID=1417629 RepID=A0A841KYH5_9FIRM|nr:GNAT family N-acetyltransferase [Anaerosolibacter carboniphilus]MBB6215185.1 N-acetylglutamate synthase-like GNAT family acetyltransferase [Anaerosolibacter carboniphilus]
MTDIRRAKISDSEILTNIAVESEAYWGYDSDFMEKFKMIYKVTEDFISNNPTYVIQEEEKIVGFYGLLIDGHENSLEYLFIEPKSIGKGYGKALWTHMIKTCETLGIRELVIVAGPDAKAFYTKMGAVPSGEVESLVRKGRKVPRLIYTL